MKQKGFTLIELLVVISIIALLASVVLASLNNARDKGRMGGARYFASQVDHVASDSAAGIWDFEECTGTAASDQSGNGNTINLQNGASMLSTGATGQGCAALFDGTNDYGNAGQVTAISGTNPFTLSLWVRNDRIAVAYDSPIAKSYWTGSSDVGWMLTSYGPGNNTLYFRGLSATAQCFGLSAPSPLSVGVWKHVAVTSGGTSAKMYIDGILVQTSSVTCGIDSAPAYNLYIGARSEGVQYFKGAVDGLRIFSKTLTASDVGQLFTEGAQRHGLADNIQ